MIYLTSDLHGGESIAGLLQYLEVYREGDLLLILGDVGLSFEDTEENRRFTEWFLRLDRPIAFLDGNHENHPYLNAFPEEQWHGGTVNRLTEHIVRLKRGQIFRLDGHSFFVMGGCKSSERWRERGLLYEGEEPSCEELCSAYDALDRHGPAVDYILTHYYLPGMAGEPTTLGGLFAHLDAKVAFRRWYAGHLHLTMAFDPRHVIVYDTLLTLS